MSLSIADLENRIRIRLQVLYNGDLDAAVNAKIDALIDELLARFIEDGARAAVLSTMQNSERVQKLTEKACRLAP